MTLDFRRHGCRAALRAALPGLLLLLCLSAPARGLVRVPAQPAKVAGNPADALSKLAIEASKYDKATRCSKARRPGMVAFERWLKRNVRGTSWGTYRCEKWGKRSASLHAEGRAIDWHLDRSKRVEAREAKRLILLMLAPDRAGNRQALARRMGVEEIIWDCGYWQAGMTKFKKYGGCYSKSGKLRRNVSATVAHRDHVHFGLTKSGAAKKTSFWTRRAARLADRDRDGVEFDGAAEGADDPADAGDGYDDNWADDYDPDADENYDPEADPEADPGGGDAGGGGAPAR